MFNIITGIAINIPAYKKLTNDLSYIIFNNSSGIQPTGEVFLIINDTDISAVIFIVFVSNLSLTSKK